MGSKIPSIIIVLAVVGLAGVMFDSNLKSNDDSSKEIVKNDPIDAITLNVKSGKILVFEDYPVIEQYLGGVAQIDFTNHELLEEFSSVMQASLNDFGVNFAGKYSVITWGCGVDCQNSTVIDVSNGEIVEYGLITAYGLSYSPDSRLLIINPEVNIPDDYLESDIDTTTDYYIVDNDLNKLAFVEKTVPGNGPVDACIQATASARNFLTDEVREFKTTCSIPFGWELISGVLNN